MTVPLHLICILWELNEASENWSYFCTQWVVQTNSSIADKHRHRSNNIHRSHDALYFINNVNIKPK